jgi:hypothetical protein
MDKELSLWERSSGKGYGAYKQQIQLSLADKSDVQRAELLAQFGFWDGYVDLITESTTARQHMLQLN